MFMTAISLMKFKTLHSPIKILYMFSQKKKIPISNKWSYLKGTELKYCWSQAIMDFPQDIYMEISVFYRKYSNI
jgi:hypothetical protein